MLFFEHIIIFYIVLCTFDIILNCSSSTVLELYVTVRRLHSLCVSVRLAFQSLQNIAADLPDWRSDVVTGMSVCLSVRLSVTLVNCDHVVQHKVQLDT